MTVEELIQILVACPQDAQVTVFSDDTQHCVLLAYVNVDVENNEVSLYSVE